MRATCVPGNYAKVANSSLGDLKKKLMYDDMWKAFDTVVYLFGELVEYIHIAKLSPSSSSSWAELALIPSQTTPTPPPPHPHPGKVGKLEISAHYAF
jgi:hypothetical protein